jgi:D-alanyl-D-alanine carboxypeptidase/D-alanyl-D-alanine-endopeptidase (penicillin-binding protein 4)
MKYLGDSLSGWSIHEGEDFVNFIPNGDPTFLHPDFKKQNFFNYLSSSKKRLVLVHRPDQFKQLGSGWAWNDFGESYMVERSRFPIYGNLVSFEMNSTRLTASPRIFLYPPYFFSGHKEFTDKSLNFSIQRRLGENVFTVVQSSRPFTRVQIPFTTTDPTWSLQRNLLNDTLGRNDTIWQTFSRYDLSPFKTQPTDSLLKPMMHRSDNFFAEQSLLMASNELLGVMDDAKIIDTILKTDFKDLPQKPRWADGSGLSRYNLFTPQDFVVILTKMKNEFGIDRIKEIFPTGGEGTLSSYYKQDSTFIYAKTGTLSGVVALSGYLFTRKGKMLIFSVLVNNHNTSATAIRRAVEKFLQGVRNIY